MLLYIRFGRTVPNSSVKSSIVHILININSINFNVYAYLIVFIWICIIHFSLIQYNYSLAMDVMANPNNHVMSANQSNSSGQEYYSSLDRTVLVIVMSLFIVLTLTGLCILIPLFLSLLLSDFLSLFVSFSLPLSLVLSPSTRQSPSFFVLSLCLPFAHSLFFVMCA